MCDSLITSFFFLFVPSLFFTVFTVVVLCHGSCGLHSLHLVGACKSWPVHSRLSVLCRCSLIANYDIDAVAVRHGFEGQWLRCTWLGRIFVFQVNEIIKVLNVLTYCKGR